MKKYKGYYYFLDEDNLWKVKIGKNTFVVALDDSKEIGKRKIINSKNTERTCKKFIDVIS